MRYKQTTSIETWLMMLRVDMTLATILLTILFMIHLIARHLDSSKMNCIQCLCENLLDYVQNAMPFSVRTEDKNVLQHTKLVKKKTAKGVKHKVKDDHLHFAHYLDLLHSFKSYVWKQNLISSTDHNVRTVHITKLV